MTGMWIFVAAITLAALAVGVPMVVLKTLMLVETAGSWTLERMHRLGRQRSTAAGRESSDLLSLPRPEQAPTQTES